MSKIKTKNLINIIKWFFVFFIIFFIVFLVIKIKKSGFYNKLNSIDKIRNTVESFGMYGSFAFILIQILQTTILQIPSIIVTMAGAIIFGPVKAFVLSFISIMIGSLLMFYAGRKFGKNLLVLFIGEKNSNKLINLVSQTKYLYFLMMLFPLFPDDILCLVAGVGQMDFKYFFWTNIISRALGIACATFFGSGKIIPFTGWGIPVWSVIGIILLSMFYLSVRFKDKIDETIFNWSKNKSQ